MNRSKSIPKISRDVAFEIARCYVNDYCWVLADEEHKYLIGLIRSRNVVSLSSCFTSDHPLSKSIREHGLVGFKLLRQLEALFKKNASFRDPKVAIAAAIESFNDSEAQCLTTNQRLDEWYFDGPKGPDDFKREICVMKNWIANVLGDFTSFEKTIYRRLRVTSGATAELPRKQAQPFKKVSPVVRCTWPVWRYYDALGNTLGYKIAHSIAMCNRVQTVPKSWKTDRTIACEPTGNMPIQLAFDEYAKSQLKRCGIDLTDQTKNQYYAKLGSLDDKTSTIDLKAASDTVSLATVALLFPARWFKFVFDARSPLYRKVGPDGKPTGEIARYEKFSSMGNGSTFAIETLIFGAACKAAGASWFNVYGDDIVIETRYAAALIRILQFLGFSTNIDKTYIHGPFRESCGMDYYQGTDITPFYLREMDGRTLRPTICHNVNGLASLSYPGGQLEKFLLKIVKEQKLPLVPLNGSSTSGVFVNMTEAYRRKLVKSIGRKWVPSFRGYVSNTVQVSIYDSRALFLWHLQKLRRPNEDYESSVYTDTKDDMKSKYRMKWVLWSYHGGTEPDHLYGWSAAIQREIPLKRL